MNTWWLWSRLMWRILINYTDSHLETKGGTTTARTRGEDWHFIERFFTRPFVETVYYEPHTYAVIIYQILHVFFKEEIDFIKLRDLQELQSKNILLQNFGTGVLYKGSQKFDVLLTMYLECNRVKKNQFDAQSSSNPTRTTDSHLKGISTNCCIGTVVPPDERPRYARNM